VGLHTERIEPDAGAIRIPAVGDRHSADDLCDGEVAAGVGLGIRVIELLLQGVEELEGAHIGLLLHPFDEENGSGVAQANERTGFSTGSLAPCDAWRWPRERKGVWWRRSRGWCGWLTVPGWIHREAPLTEPRGNRRMDLLSCLVGLVCLTEEVEEQVAEIRLAEATCGVLVARSLEGGLEGVQICAGGRADQTGVPDGRQRIGDMGVVASVRLTVHEFPSWCGVVEKVFGRGDEIRILLEEGPVFGEGFTPELDVLEDILADDGGGHCVVWFRVEYRLLSTSPLASERAFMGGQLFLGRATFQKLP